MWDEDVIESTTQPKQVIRLEDLEDGRCKATTWGPSRTKLPRNPTYENHFGPGGYNRCIGGDGHRNPLHKDEWGHVFKVDPDGSCRTVRTEKPEEQKS